MAFHIEQKLVISIASSALFDLSDSDKVFKEKGEAAYKDFQAKNKDKVLKKGVAFPFIKRFLSLNEAFPNEQPVEVVLLSRNSPETGIRVFNSIQHYGLNIVRAAFFNGNSPFEYIKAYNASLFLSANAQDVKKAIQAGFPAGHVIKSVVTDDEDCELRIAFDFDGVIVDDEAEAVYKNTGDLKEFYKLESSKVNVVHNPGPLGELFKKIAVFQKLEREKQKQDKNYQRILKTAIVTARSAPAHERVVNTLKSWDINVDEAFFLGGIEKSRILEIMKPHMFFDDQKTHLKENTNIPMVHIPFGAANKE